MIYAENHLRICHNFLIFTTSENNFMIVMILCSFARLNRVSQNFAVKINMCLIERFFHNYTKIQKL